MKSQGVRRMEQIGIVIGIKFMAKPGEQFILRREVYQRVRDAFEKNGIDFARPQVTVQMPGGRTAAVDPQAMDPKTLDPNAIAHAAAETVMEDMAEAEAAKARRKRG